MRAFEVLRSYEPITKRSVHGSFHEHAEDPHRWLSGDAILSLYDLLVTVLQHKASDLLPPLSFAQLSHQQGEITEPVAQNGESSCLLVFDALDSQLVCPCVKEFLRESMPSQGVKKEEEQEQEQEQEQEEEEEEEEEEEDDDVEILSAELLEHRVALQNKLVHLMRLRQNFTIVGPLNVVAHWVVLTVSVRFDCHTETPSVFVYIDDPQSYNRSQLTAGDYSRDLRMYQYLSSSVQQFIRRWGLYQGDLLIYADIVAHGLQDDHNTNDCGIHCVNMLLSTTVVHAYKAANPMRYGCDDISDRDRAYYNSAIIGHRDTQLSTQLLRYLLAFFVYYFQQETTHPDSSAVTSWLYYAEHGTIPQQTQEFIIGSVSTFVDRTIINILTLTERARTKRLASTDYERLMEYVKRSYSTQVMLNYTPDWPTFKIIWNVHVDYDRSYNDCLLLRKHLTVKETWDKCRAFDPDIPERLIKFVLNHCPCKNHR